MGLKSTDLFQLQTTMSELTMIQLSSAFTVALAKITLISGIQTGLSMEALHQQCLLPLQPQQHSPNTSDSGVDLQCCLVGGKKGGKKNVETFLC